MVAAKKKEGSLKVFFWCLIALILFANGKPLLQVPKPTAAASLMIGVACLYPFYLWCEGKVKGIPVFPFFGLTYLYTFALPLLSQNPNILKYSPAEHLFAAVCTVVFLVSGTVVWYPMVKKDIPQKKAQFSLKADKADTFFIIMTGIGAWLNMYTMGGWTGIPEKIFTIVRGVVLGLSFLGIFVVAYRCGREDMSKSKQRIFFIFLVLNIMSAAASLILKTALTLFMLSTVAFLIGGRRLPYLPLMLGIVLLIPLHYGKHEMRHLYMKEGAPPHYVQPWEYPAWFVEWGGYASKGLNPPPRKRWEEEPEEKESFIERSSVIHMLMLGQEKIPSPFPYLGGATYAILPEMIVPRILYPQKRRTHEGTHMLNIHIKRQTYQDTIRTTIAWGLLPEAYANFGIIGCGTVGAFLGAMYGFVTRMGIGKAAFSFPTLFCILVMSMALASTEWTAGVYAASLFQATVPIYAIRLIFMKKEKIDKARKRQATQLSQSREC
jgi:hypothetical protein